MWLQPGGWVHKMFHDSWQPLAAEVALGGQPLPSAECELQGERCQPKWMNQTAGSYYDPGACCRASASAAFSDDRAQLTLRFVNPSNATSGTVTAIAPGGCGGATGWRVANVTQLAHGDLTDANPADDMLHISPVAAGWSGCSFVAPPQSVSVVMMVRAAQAPPGA